MNTLSKISRALSNPKLIYDYFFFRINYRLCPYRYKSILKNIRQKEHLTVCFFTTQPAIWKYDYLYKILEKDSRFTPIILVIPIVNKGRDYMLHELDSCFNYFKKKNYNVLNSCDINGNPILDIKKEINPDIIFYCNPYFEMLDHRHIITKFLDRLTCYVPYYYEYSTDFKYWNNGAFHNLLWRYYIVSDYYKTLAKTELSTKGKNMVVTGYPGIDCFLDKTYQPNNPWKIKDSSIKKIIWAPHHTINEKGILNHSCFFKYCDFMLEIAEKYNTKIQIAFKPHPSLIVRLYQTWGKEKTDNYYAKWEALPNGMLYESNYVDLFLTSDAMIHDSGSFLFEYMFTGKPVMRTHSKEVYKDVYNDLAMECLQYYYHAYNKEDIESFIINVINDVDDMKEERHRYIKNKLFPPHNVFASENVYHSLLEDLQWKKL